MYTPPIVQAEAVKDQGFPSPPHNTNGNEGENPHTARQLKGAAVAGGVAGLMLVGPVVGVAAAAGAAYAVTAKGDGGKIARNVGDSVADADRVDDRRHVVSGTPLRRAAGLHRPKFWKLPFQFGHDLSR